MDIRFATAAPRVRACVTGLLAVFPLAWPAGATGSELSGIVTLASEYIYRGQALSDNNPAVQAGVDYEHDAGWFAGVWASTVDLPNPTGRRDVELDYYAGYHFASDSPFSAAVSLVRYTYPGQTGVIDYDYTEAIVVASWKERFSIELGYTDDLYGFDVPGRHAELRGDWPWLGAWVVSAGAGYNDIEETTTSSYWYWDLGASARFSRLTVDLRWYDNETPRGFLDRLSAGSRVVVALSAAF